MYEILHHHTGDQDSLVATVKSYSQAVLIMKSIAKQWKQYTVGNIVAKRNRIEYRAQGWGIAVYIEQV